ncbi:fimbrial assembly protein piln, putative [Heliomicrobium modesticaldum Ice1]|uniref:Fimbrial assembly protein piln, putative n=1 Tax=Heliobacterium modesticaldum (strain ATCC 51547 / Ice1) TaxID=498761 RepID=B0TEF4_HELMI|nr:PilN domain-containing protein [Heliomicrobium modesticaldum]ABZ82873.1 fimbrial assembly protein piln, putative [Heliomicrobium modesticaldum Ice1]
MQSINLLPLELRPKKLDKRALFIRSGLAVGLLACVAAYGAFLGKLYLSRQESEGIAVEMAELQPELRRVEAVEKEIREIRQKAEILDKLRIARVPWSKVFTDVAAMTPDGLWLATVTLNENNAEKATLRIEGETTAFEQVGLFILQLRQLPYFSDVELVDARDKAVDRRWVTRFQVEAQLAPMPKELLPSNPNPAKTSGAAQGGERR